MPEAWKDTGYHYLFLPGHQLFYLKLPDLAARLISGFFICPLKDLTDPGLLHQSFFAGLSCLGQSENFFFSEAG